MQLTPRRRIVVSVLASWPVGYFYLDWVAHLVFELLSFHRTGNTVCRHSGVIGLADRWNNCQMSSFSSTSAIVELLVLTTLAVLLAYALGRWVTWPIRAMASTITQLGPTSLGLRLRQTGQRDETRQLADAIDALLDRVAEGYEAQRRFAANASHELRTPLAVQRALIEVSLASALSPEQTELLTRQLLATNERNERLIEGLLVLAETEQGVLATHALRLDAIAAGVLESHRSAADKLRISLVGQLAPCTIRGEQPLIERLLTNLVQNAVKYNQDDGWVRVEVEADGLLTVTNSGPRLAPESVPGLFEPFRRGNGERLEHSGGAGLGLTIVRSIVAAHHGTLDAVAGPAGGLLVRVRLPALTGPDQPARRPALRTAEPLTGT